VSTPRGVKTLFFVDFSADEGPKNSRSLARQQWNAVLKTGCSIAVRASAVGTFERGVEHAGLDAVFIGGATAAALG
jgi:hypothetical protein